MTLLAKTYLPQGNGPCGFMIVPKETRSRGECQILVYVLYFYCTNALFSSEVLWSPCQAESHPRGLSMLL